MRKALIPAFLLVATALVLGSTVFREQVVSAATTPFQSVVVTNANTNPIPVQQIGTSTTSVSGTVGIDSSKNTVKLDSSGNTVNLDPTDSGHLANIENELGNLKFDTSGNLETTGSATPSPVSEQCLDSGESTWVVKNDTQLETLCTDDVDATSITAAGMDDVLEVDFSYQGNVVLSLSGSGNGGSDSYHFDLTHPLHFDKITARCGDANNFCIFSIVVLGTSGT